MGPARPQRATRSPPGLFRWWVLLFPAAHPAGVLSTAPSLHLQPGGTRQRYFSMGEAGLGARREVSAPAAGHGGGCGPCPAWVPWAAPGLRGGPAAASPGLRDAGRAHAALGRPTLPGSCHPRRPRSSPRLSKPQPTALYLLQLGLTSGRGQPERREPQNTQPQRQVCPQLPPGPSRFSLQPCLPSQNNNKSPRGRGSPYLPVPHLGKDRHPGCGLRVPRSLLVMDCEGKPLAWDACG